MWEIVTLFKLNVRSLALVSEENTPIILFRGQHQQQTGSCYEDKTLILKLRSDEIQEYVLD